MKCIFNLNVLMKYVSIKMQALFPSFKSINDNSRAVTYKKNRLNMNSN